MKINTGTTTSSKLVYLEEHVAESGHVDFKRRELALTRVWFDVDDRKAIAKFASAILGRKLSEVDDEHFIVWLRRDDDGSTYAAVSWLRPEV